MGADILYLWLFSLEFSLLAQERVALLVNREEKRGGLEERRREEWSSKFEGKHAVSTEPLT